MITELMSLQNQLRILHWQTKSFSEHKALGKCYEGLDTLIDLFVEIRFGKYGVRRAKETFNFSLQNYEDTSPVLILNTGIDFLTTNLVDEKDTDLANVRDEMLGLLNRTKYLLTLQ
jgi:hypothetical protein